MDDKYIGFLLAVASTIFIGTSFVVKKMGLIESEGHGACPNPPRPLSPTVEIEGKMCCGCEEGWWRHHPPTTYHVAMMM